MTNQTLPTAVGRSETPVRPLYAVATMIEHYGSPTDPNSEVIGATSTSATVRMGLWAEGARVGTLDISLATGAAPVDGGTALTVTVNRHAAEGAVLDEHNIGTVPATRWAQSIADWLAADAVRMARRGEAEVSTDSPGPGELLASAVAALAAGSLAADGEAVWRVTSAMYDDLAGRQDFHLSSRRGQSLTCIEATGSQVGVQLFENGCLVGQSWGPLTSGPGHPASDLSAAVRTALAASPAAPGPEGLGR